MKRIITLAALALLAAPHASSAQSAFTIGDNGITFSLQPYTTSTSDGPAANLGGNGVDHLVQNCWWYGIGLNRTREFTFAAADYTSSGFDSTRAFHQVLDVGSLTFRFDYSIARVDADAAILTQTVTVTNHSIFPASVDLFNYIDPSIGTSTEGDRAVEIPRADTIRIIDATTHDVARVYAPASFASRVGTAPSVRNLLTDADLDIFDNSGLPYVGADCSLGFQWRFEGIPRGRSRSCTVIFAVNTPQPHVPTGACSLGNKACAFTTEHDCITRGGAFLGDGTHCPNPACPCDWNLSGALNSQDFFDFISDFFAGFADYNFDGVVNSQDYFDFVNCFFNGPASCIP